MPSNQPSGSAAASFLCSSAAPRVLPFASLMVLIGVEEVLRALTTRGIVPFPPGWFLFLYPVRIIIAGAVLAFCLKRCDELHLSICAGRCTRPRAWQPALRSTFSG